MIYHGGRGGDLTAEELRSVLDYDPVTGSFIWKIRSGAKIREGFFAGCLQPDGYVVIGYKKQVYKAHRLAWLYVYGCFPEGIVDHINGNKADNRISNLRDATYRDNAGNTPKHRLGKLVGANKIKGRGNWRATISVGSKSVHLGCFATEREAHEAYMQVKKDAMFQP